MIKLSSLLVALLCFISISSFGQNALFFDGNNDYVQTTATPPLGKNARTLECWVKPYYVKKQSVIMCYGAMDTARIWNWV